MPSLGMLVWFLHVPVGRSQWGMISMVNRTLPWHANTDTLGESCISSKTFGFQSIRIHAGTQSYEQLFVFWKADQGKIHRKLWRRIENIGRCLFVFLPSYTICPPTSVLPTPTNRGFTRFQTGSLSPLYMETPGIESVTFSPQSMCSMPLSSLKLLAIGCPRVLRSLTFAFPTPTPILSSQQSSTE